MKKAKNKLLTLLGGVGMLIVGLFILSQKVIVYTGFYSILGFRMNSGLIMIPFIIAIVWLFASGGSFGAKVLTCLSVAFIVISIVMSVSVYLMSMTLFDWVVLIVLIFGGLGMIIRALFASDSAGRKNTRSQSQSINSPSIEESLISIDEELKRLKSGK